MWWLSLASFVVAGIFTAVLARQYKERRRTHQLFWTVGLLMFALATLGEFIGGLVGWSEGIYKMYYFAGVALPGMLGVGSVYLMARQRPVIAHGYAAAVIVITVAFFVAVVGAELNGTALAESGIAPAHGDIMPETARRPYSLLLSAVGGSVMVLSSLYSWIRFRLKYNSLIFSGGLLFVVSGVLASRFELLTLHSLANLVGIGLIFVGVMAAARPPRPAPVPTG